MVELRCADTWFTKMLLLKEETQKSGRVIFSARDLTDENLLSEKRPRASSQYMNVCSGEMQKVKISGPVT